MTCHSLQEVNFSGQ